MRCYTFVVALARLADTHGVVAKNLLDLLEARLGLCDVLVYNVAAMNGGTPREIDRTTIAKDFHVNVLGAHQAACRVAPAMVRAGHGAILFTGASAGVKGYPESASFAMGKFALRGLSQSLARELQPRGIHVAHFVIDGAIGPARGGGNGGGEDPDSTLDPDAIARTYLDVARQHRSAWTSEVELRPWVEGF